MSFSIELNTLSPSVLSQIAKESKDAETLKKLIAVNENAVYLDVVRNIHADKETLKTLYEKYKSSDHVIYALRKNISTPTDILHEITQNTDEGWRAEHLLGNPSLLAGDLDDLYERFHGARNLSKFVEKIVRHPNTSATTLIKIAEWDSRFAGQLLDTGKVKLVPKDD